jgi:hypothetical protein
VSNTITFDLDRMRSAAHALYETRTRMEALSQRIGRIDADAVKDPAMKAYLSSGGRRLELMAHGDAGELAAVEHSVRGAMRRALAADAPSRRPSRAKVKHKPKPGGKVRAGGHGKRLPYPGHAAGQQQMACWLASRAGGMGVPPELLVSAALVESSLRNRVGGDASSTGLFQIQVSIHRVPPGFGSASGTLENERWWTDHPEAQLQWFGAHARAAAGGRGVNTSGARAVGDWAADIERPAAKYRGRYAERYGDAHRMVGNCRSAGGPHAPTRRPLPGAAKRAALGARIDRMAERMIGIERHHDAFALMQRQVRSGGQAPWCAAFAYSAVLKAGKRLPGSGWAAVGTWVQRARARQCGLSVVPASEAKPGDLVAYDWNGGNNFWGGHEHIGVLDSRVRRGAFTTIEGNTTGNHVSTHRTRTMAAAPNVVFIRVSP